MSTQFLISGASFVHVSPTKLDVSTLASKDNWVNFGLRDVQIPISHQIRELQDFRPAAFHAQTGRYDNRVASFQVDWNMPTGWVGWMEGTDNNTCYVYYAFRGTASGSPLLWFELAVTSFNRTEPDNALKWNVQGNIQGPVNDVTFS